MLIQIKVAGFRSIGKEVILSFMPVTTDKQYQENIFRIGSYTALNTLAIYGKNGSGKSSLFNAISCMQKMVLSSDGYKTRQCLPFAPFFWSDPDLALTEFEIIFIGGNQVKYRYGFCYNAVAVQREWLYRQEVNQLDEINLFERECDIIDANHNSFKDQEKQINKAIVATGSNNLFLTTCTNMKIEEAVVVLDWFGKQCKVVGEGELSTDVIKKSYAFINMYKTLAIKLFDAFNLDMTPLSFSEEAQNSGIGYGSSGTRQIIQMLEPLINALMEGGLLAIDDIDRGLHPALKLKLIEIFLDPATNPNRSQLFFSTNDTCLMTHTKTREDQIYFAEKNKDATELFCLSDFVYFEDWQAQNNPDSSFLESKRLENHSPAVRGERYLTGRYGAVPSIGDLKQILQNYLFS